MYKYITYHDCYEDHAPDSMVESTVRDDLQLGYCDMNIAWFRFSSTPKEDGGGKEKKVEGICPNSRF